MHCVILIMIKKHIFLDKVMINCFLDLKTFYSHCFFPFFVPHFSFTDDSEETIFIILYHFHPLINIQIFICPFALCMWDDYLVFLVVSYVITWLLLDWNYLPLVISIWLDVNCSFTWWSNDRFYFIVLTYIFS